MTIPSGQTLVQIPQLMHLSKLTTGRKVRQDPVWFFMVVFGWTLMFIFIRVLCWLGKVSGTRVEAR